VGQGQALFTARVWDPGDEVKPFFHPKPVGVWRREWGLPDGSARIPAPSNMKLSAGSDIPAAVIPAAILDALPEGTLIEVAWGVYYGGAT